MIDFVLLGSAAFLAGLVDAVVGGGGLIQIPVMFSVFPNAVPATLLGTSKLAGIFGTGAAAVATGGGGPTRGLWPSQRSPPSKATAKMATTVMRTSPFIAKD